MKDFDRCMACMQPLNGYEVCAHCGWQKDVEQNDPSQLAMGTVLVDRYIIGKAIGLGGFGITYVAWDTLLKQKVAVKEYYPTGFAGRAPGGQNVVAFSGSRKEQYKNGLKRFLSEARNMAKFSNDPNIVNVVDFFETNDTAYIVMEFLDGINLKQYLKQMGGILPYNIAVSIIRPICYALTKIHKTGIVHRDVSPDNIIITASNHIKLIDFGAARLSSGEKEETLSVILKPGFAPPEQYRTKSKQGAFTDIYALGATFYRMITGKMPPESVDRLTGEELELPSALVPGIPEIIDRAVMRAMALDHTVRFKNAEEFLRALDGEQIARYPHEVISRRRRRNLAIVLSTASVAIAGCISLFAVFGGKKLKPAQLNVWIPKYDFELTDKQLGIIFSKERNADGSFKETDSIIGAFFEEYPNLKNNQDMEIIIREIPAQDYIDELVKTAEGKANDGVMPDIFTLSVYDVNSLNGFTFDCTAAMYYNDAVFKRTADISSDVSAFIKNAGTQNYYFMDNYNEYFPSGKFMPTSFRVPIVYEKTGEMQTDLQSGKIFKSSDEIITKFGKQHWCLPEYIWNCAACSFADSSEPGEISNYIEIMKQKNIRNETPAVFADNDEINMYIGWHGDLKWVQSKLRANYVSYPALNSVELTGIWCVGDNGDKNKTRTAAALLTELLDDNAQQLLGMGTSNLPLSKKAFKECNNSLQNLFADEYIKRIDRCVACGGEGAYTKSFTTAGEVPNLLNTTIEEAKVKLACLGYTVKIREECSDTYEYGFVYAQEPDAGSKISSGESVTLIVSLGSKITGIEISQDKLTLSLEETHEIAILPNPSNAYIRTWDITWSSSNEKVVSAVKTEDGKCTITAKQEGTASITVTVKQGDSTFTAVCEVTVSP